MTNTAATLSTNMAEPAVLFTPGSSTVFTGDNGGAAADVRSNDMINRTTKKLAASWFKRRRNTRITGATGQRQPLGVRVAASVAR